jgi:hypothetical protein
MLTDELHSRGWTTASEPSIASKSTVCRMFQDPTLKGGAPADIGREAIRAANERGTAARPDMKFSVCSGTQGHYDRR